MISRNPKRLGVFLLVGLLLVCLNVAGAIGTHNARLRDQAARVRIFERVAWYPPGWDPRSGDIHFGLGLLDTGELLVRIMRLPGWPSFLETWSPVIASLSASLLILTVVLGGMSVRCPPAGPGRADDRSPRRSLRESRVTATTAVALIGLNIAGALFGRFPEPGQEEPHPKNFSGPTAVPDQDGSLAVEDGAGRIVRISPTGNVRRLATVSDYPLPLHQFDTRTRVKETVEYRSDGSVVAYAGNPGFLQRLVTRPRVLQPSTRSFLEVWWPAIGSMFVSLFLLFGAWRQTRARSLRRRGASSASIRPGSNLTCIESSS